MAARSCNALVCRRLVEAAIELSAVRCVPAIVEHVGFEEGCDVMEGIAETMEYKGEDYGVPRMRGRGQCAAVRAFMLAGAAPPATPSAVAQFHNVHLLKAMLDSGVDFSTGAPHPEWLDHCMMSRNAKALRMLLQHAKSHGITVDVDKDSSMVHAGLELRMLAALLEHGANPNLYVPSHVHREELHVAAQALLPFAVDLDEHAAAAPSGRQPVLTTAHVGVQMLVAAGMDPDAPATVCEPGLPLLVHFFCALGDEAAAKPDSPAVRCITRCVDLLLAAGADLFQRDATGIDSFFAAARWGGVEVLRKMLAAGGITCGGEIRPTAGHRDVTALQAATSRHLSDSRRGLVSRAAYVSVVGGHRGDPHGCSASRVTRDRHLVRGAALHQRWAVARAGPCSRRHPRAAAACRRGGGAVAGWHGHHSRAAVPGARGHDASVAGAGGLVDWRAGARLLLVGRQ